MRGKVKCEVRFAITRRITPAYAGKRFLFCISTTLGRDHPRLCGEKLLLSKIPQIAAGSPPPMRGKVRVVVIKSRFRRITPAYAGKSDEKILRQFGVPGSPPPMRGKVYGTTLHGQPHRITPAYAGKSRGATSPACPSWDHPRLCGEKAKKIPKQRYFFHQLASFSFSLQYT